MRIADEPEAFAAAVTEIYESPETCLSMSEATQSYIREHFSVDAAWKVIEEDFTKES